MMYVANLDENSIKSGNIYNQKLRDLIIKLIPRRIVNILQKKFGAFIFATAKKIES